jgi:hypothetical protein
MSMCFLGEDNDLALTLSQWIFCEAQRFEMGTPLIQSVNIARTMEFVTRKREGFKSL